MKEIWKKLKIEIVWRLLWFISTAIAMTVRIRVVNLDRLEKILNSGKGGIMATWHGTTILPIYYCRYKGLWAIVSVSRDGELQARLLRARGYNIIRGSSRSHAIRALLEAVRAIDDGAVMALTPDGPRGPAKVVQPGIVFMAERSGCDILPVGIACSRVYRFNSWDKHEVPKPFSKAVLVFGDIVRVGECETDEDREKWAEVIAEAINKAYAEAAELLFGGKGKQNVSSL